jgi:hypothetical protein
VQTELQATLQYAGKPVQAVSTLPRTEKEGFGDYVSRNIGRLSWQLMKFRTRLRHQSRDGCCGPDNLAADSAGNRRGCD